MSCRTFRMLASACLICVNLFAQEFRSTISGHIYDASGSAIPGAKLAAINVDSNETTNATSDTSGGYSIPFLRPGNYRMTVSAAGFKTHQREGIVLEAAKIAGIDINLEVGQLTETVNVVAEAAVLETQTAMRGGVVTNQQVAELPLNARNPFMLGTMMSGVTFNGAAIWQRPFDNGAIAQWSVNGSRDSSTEYMLDGASNGGQMGSNNIALVPIVDAVQEFNMMSNLYNAEYGRTGGGIMNVVLKSGGATFHGSAWEFMRRQSLDANTFQNNATGAKRPAHYLDQYGFQVEGPVYIPKLLTKSSAVKLFYSGAFENYREGTPNPLIVSWPEKEMRGGDFSKLVNAQGQKVTLYNPFDYTLDASGNPVRNPFPNNVIPGSMINPVARTVTGYMPEPNRAAPAGQRYSTSNLFLPDYYDKDKFYNLSLKFDWNFGDRHRAFFRHASNDRTEDRAVNGVDNKPGTDGQQPFQRINDAYVVDWVGTISPSLVLNARASYNRFIEKGFGRANEGFDLSKLGLPASLLSAIPGKAYFGRWNLDGYNSLGRGQSNNFTNTYQAEFSVTKIFSGHTMKAGFDIRQINYLQQNTGDILSFTGNTTWTSRLWNQNDTVSGDGYATFLLGIPSGTSNYPLFPWWKQIYSAPYIQDDWKVSRRLTLNLGLRIDFNAAPHEKWNRMNGPFDANVTSPLASQINLAGVTGIPADMQRYYDALRNLKGGMTFAGVGGIGSTPAKLNKNNWQPRFGAAYQINDRLVMRGGIGLYYSNPNNDYFQTAGFSTSTTLVNSNDGGRTAIANVLSNPYPTGISLPTGSSLGPLTFVGRNNNWFNSNFRTPKVWSFSFGFQYQVTKASMLDFSYVGSRSTDMNMSRDYNLVSNDFRKLCSGTQGGNANFCDAQVPNPFRGLSAFNGTGFFTANTISRFQMARLFPQFNGNLTEAGRNEAKLWYDSLQVNYNFRLRGGLSLLGNYTLSKQIEQSGFNDPYNNVLQKSVYFLDRPQVLKVTAIYELPFGRGRKFMNSSNGFVDRLVSGWQVTNFVVNPNLGFPADLPSNVIPLKSPLTAAGWSGKTDWKANQVRAWSPCVLRQQSDGSIAPMPYSLAAGCGTDQSNYVWLFTAVGSGQSAGSGYEPRYTPNRTGEVRRHHAFQWDASITKTTQITERIRAQVGFEAFNLANHNYFGRDQFNTDPNNPNFGTIFPSLVSTQNMLPRQIQVRLKVNW
ncbi:MAG: TonB-dependent receptor [Acidobacteria bacterium]|nr:TonB-dependent receptor [Acidobacteriota bacterium]